MANSDITSVNFIAGGQFEISWFGWEVKANKQ